MANDQGSTLNGSNFPSWIKASLFENVFKEIVPEFRQTKDFQVKNALSAGENYATVMLRVEAELELMDGSSKSVTLMLKTAHDNERFRQMMKSHNLFDIESRMYREVVTEFEQMYKEIGIEVQFGPKSYQLDTEEYYILLEDLKPQGFVNANRLEGLDMDHTHSVLKKLAQWHAASAVRVANKGSYPQIICDGYIKKDTVQMIKIVLNSSNQIQMKCMKSYKGHELYYERVNEKKDERVEELFNVAKVDVNDFNVLNHGDCWSNNIMFKHDAFGKIKLTYFVDYQLPRYGSPAQDLYYFILTSTKYELKLKQFDYFIKYYHSELVEHLKLLNYSKKLPSLRDIHVMLHKYNPWALSTVTGAMAAVLLDPQEDASLNNMMGQDDAANKLKYQMYSNDRYRKHCEMIYPWLYNRGAL